MITLKFQKINENVIRCIISQEEMNMHGINIDDLMVDRSKAEKFLQTVLTAAKYEVDFVTNGDVLNVQVSVTRGGEISMMISDDQNATIRAIAEQFKNKLMEISKALEERAAKEKQEETKGTSKESILKSLVEWDEAAIPEGSGKEAEIPYTFWARLSSIEDCIKMAKALSKSRIDSSTLYKYYDEYFLSVSLFTTKTKTALCVLTMSEYSDDVSIETKEYLMVAEHGQVIINEDAVSKLLELA